MANPYLPAAIRAAEEALALRNRLTEHREADLMESALRSLLSALPAEGEAPAPQPAPTPEPVSPAYKLPPEVEAELAPIRGLRITADEIRAALKSVMPYGPGQRDEAFVQVAAEAAASSLAALSYARGSRGER